MSSFRLSVCWLQEEQKLNVWTDFHEIFGTGEFYEKLSSHLDFDANRTILMTTLRNRVFLTECY
jgi:hypothetical protein